MIFVILTNTEMCNVHISIILEGLEYCLGNSIFSGTEQFFPWTQAFASPPDMASSGVWENIILCKTPTFDGVCGMFSYII